MPDLRTAPGVRRQRLSIAANRVPTRMYSHLTGVAAGNPTCLAYQAGSSDIIFRDGFQ